MRLANRRLGYCVNADSRRLTVFSLLCAQLAYLIDIMTIAVDVAGATFNGNAILPMGGRSLVPAFRNPPIQRDA